jgi:hypothetical protein
LKYGCKLNQPFLPSSYHPPPPAEMRVVVGKMRKTGKAAPKTLTTHQKQIVQSLLKAHGEDVQVGWDCSRRRNGRRPPDVAMLPCAAACERPPARPPACVAPRSPHPRARRAPSH